MARLKANQEEVIQTVVCVTVSLDIAVSDAEDVELIRATVKSKNLYDLINDYCYDVVSAKAKLVTIVKPVEETTDV